MITRADLPRLQARKKWLLADGEKLIREAEKEGRHWTTNERLSFNDTIRTLAQVNDDLEVARATPRSRPLTIEQRRKRLNDAMRDTPRAQRSGRPSRRSGVASKDQLWMTCLHEAAHAIVSLQDGRGCTSVSVYRDGSGITRFGDAGLRAPAVALAGPAAEAMASEGYHNTQSHRTHMKRARGQARRCIQGRMAEGRTIDQMLTQEKARARRILKARWSDVLKIASALESRRSLTGVEVKRVLGLSGDNRYGRRAA